MKDRGSHLYVEITVLCMFFYKITEKLKYFFT